MTVDGVGEVSDFMPVFMPVTGDKATDGHRRVHIIRVLRCEMRFELGCPCSLVATSSATRLDDAYASTPQAPAALSRRVKTRLTPNLAAFTRRHPPHRRDPSGHARPGRLDSRRNQRDRGFQIAQPLLDRRRHLSHVHRRHAGTPPATHSSPTPPPPSPANAASSRGRRLPFCRVASTIRPPRECPGEAVQAREKSSVDDQSRPTKYPSVQSARRLNATLSHPFDKTRVPARRGISLSLK